MLLALPAITEHIGKKKASILGAAIYIIGTLVLFAFGGSVAPVIIGLVATGLGMYLMQGIAFALAPDVMDYTEYKSGRSINGMITAYQGFLAKLAMGVSGVVIGWLL